jgi:hypothetical protein
VLECVCIAHVLPDDEDEKEDEEEKVFQNIWAIFFGISTDAVSSSRSRRAPRPGLTSSPPLPPAAAARARRSVHRLWRKMMWASKFEFLGAIY